MSNAPTSRTLARALQLFFVVGAAGLAYSFVASARDGELRKSCTSLCALAPAYAGSDRIAPDFQLPSINGTPTRLSDYRGKTVVLVFWTTTCDACKKQMPSLASLRSIIANDSRFELLTVAVDESTQDIAKALEEHAGAKDALPVMLDPESDIVLGRYGTKAFPETWIIDPSGVIRARFDGARDWSGSLALDMLRNVSRGSSCPVSVQSFMARGPGAKICQDVSM